MHGSVQLLIASSLALGVLSCASDSESRSDLPTTSLAPDGPEPTPSVATPEQGALLLGEWAIDESGGFVVFDQVGDRLAASIGQESCFTAGGFVDVDGDVVTIAPIGEETPSECDPGPPLPAVAELITCLEQGCTITRDGDAGDTLAAGSRPIVLTSTTLNL